MISVDRCGSFESQMRSAVCTLHGIAHKFVFVHLLMLVHEASCMMDTAG